MKKFLNPLRYPGSKAAFVDQFSEYVVLNGLNGRQIVEPYAGSASISFGLLAKGVVSSAILIERDPLVYAFWYCVLNHTDELIEAVQKLEISLVTWHELDRLRQVDDVAGHDLLELGVAGLFFNRTNFSGVIHAGPIGGQSQGSDYAVDCRFNKQDLVKRICTAASYRDQIQVFFGDAVAALTDANNDENSNRFFYVDPPYYKQGKKLYRYHYSDTAHKQLAATLSSAHYDWILSYDHHHVIEHFYAGFKRITKSFRYSSRVAKQEKELLITNIEGWIDGLQCKLAFDDEAKLLGGKMLASKAPELELDAVS